MPDQTGKDSQVSKKTRRYRLSFTGADAMISEFAHVAAFIVNKSVQHWSSSVIEDQSDDMKLQNIVQNVLDTLDDSTFGQEVLGKEKKSTSVRQIRELRHRIKNLTDLQISILAEGTHVEQQQITHLALIKTYAFYRDFMLDVIVSKARLYDYELSEYDYHSFISRKSSSHPELEQMTVSTMRKIKQNMIRMLDQVGVIKKSKSSELKAVILIPSLEHRVEHAILEDDSSLLAIFLQDEYPI